jgi:hypothetical protein
MDMHPLIIYQGRRYILFTNATWIFTKEPLQMTQNNKNIHPTKTLVINIRPPAH